MNELIPVTTENNIPTVSARDLHAFLEVDTGFRHWFPRMCDYGFVEARDYTPVIFDHPQNGQPITDYRLTIPMAKELCMIQRSDKGREARQYFLTVEEAWNSPEMVMARALQMAATQITGYQAQLSEMRPKADFYDTVTGSRTAIPFDQAAKVLGYRNMGRNNLFAFLRDSNVLMADNQPYQSYIDRGYFRVIETKFTKPNGDTGINIKTLIHQKGLDYVRKLLDKAGYQKSNVMLLGS